MERIDPELRYVDAASVTTPLGSLDGARLIGPSDDTLGRLEGVLIDPRERQLRYFVVERGWLQRRHYLLSASAARIEREQNALRVDVGSDELPHLTRVECHVLRPFSDDDVAGAT